MLNRFLSILGIEGRSGKTSLFARTFEPSNHPLRPIFDGRYSAMRTAMSSGDTHAIAALLTPAFVSVDVNGKATTAEQMINSVIALQIDREKRVAVTTVTDVVVRQEEAVLLQHYSMKSAPDAPLSMPRALQTLSRDVWIQAAGVWLMHRTETLEVEVVTGTGVHRHRVRSRLH
jgi:hypothetical protein